MTQLAHQRPTTPTTPTTPTLPARMYGRPRPELGGAGDDERQRADTRGHPETVWSVDTCRVSVRH